MQLVTKINSLDFKVKRSKVNVTVRQNALLRRLFAVEGHLVYYIFMQIILSNAVTRDVTDSESESDEIRHFPKSEIQRILKI